MRIRGRITSAGWLVLGLAAAIAGASFVHNVNLLRLLFTLILAAAAVGSWTGRRQLRGLIVRRTYPQSAPLGARVISTVEATNTRRSTALGISFVDRIRPKATIQPRHVRFPSIPAGAVARQTYEIVVCERGEYHLGPARIATGFPFGFVEWSTECPNSISTEPLVVYPLIGTLHARGRHVLGLAAAGAGRGRGGLVDGIDEFRGVRDYRDGDPPRLIHWRSTARRGSFVVRELEPAANGNFLFLVDPTLPNASPKSLDLVEAVLSFAATVVADVCRSSAADLTLLVAGETPAVVRGTAAMHRLVAYLRPLASARPVANPRSLVEALRLLRTTDTRDRQLWIAAAATVSAEVSDGLTAMGIRRLSPRTMLNASAGDLNGLWSPPIRAIPAAEETRNSTGPAGPPPTLPAIGR